MLHRKSVESIIIMFASLLFVFLFSQSNAQAKYMGHYQTPTELRGDWYTFIPYYKKLYHYKINKNSVYINGKETIGPNNHGDYDANFLYVKKYQKGYGGVCYNFIDKAKFGDGMIFWLSKQKVNGKRVMKMYIHQGFFTVFTRQKLNHKYSYTYNGSDYNYKIGR